MFKNKTLIWMTATTLSVLFCLAFYIFFIFKDLPPTYSVDDYKPHLVSVVQDRNGKNIGEFFKQRRTLTSSKEFPEFLITAFVAAEDGNFFKHKGLNIKSIFRALMANIKAGKKVQGGSTITQQVARSLLLSSEKTYTRKIKEAILAFRMEKHLSKEEILYLYLNQIYLGHGAYGVGMASRIYFKKEVKDLTLEEAALLAGLPQAPSRFSPISNSKKAKERQIYVLNRMQEEGYISKDILKRSVQTPITIYMRENYSSVAPYFVETIRQLLIEEIGEEKLLSGGLTITTSLDLKMQQKAQKEIKKGLKDLDKRQGFRGSLQNISQEEIKDFFVEQEKAWIRDKKTYRILKENGEDGVLDDHYKKIDIEDQTQGVVSKVENKKAYVDLMFGLKGVIPLETSKWARKPNKKVIHRLDQINSLKKALKEGDVIWVELQDSTKNKKIAEDLKEDLKNYQLLKLEQEPLVQGALLAFDQKNEDIVAMVGGYSFSKSQFNRTYQARRQTGSIFKPIIYASALDKGLTPRSMISDEPVVYEDEEADLLKRAQKEEIEQKLEKENLKEIVEETKKWKPSNYSRQFTGNILFRNALIRSLNVPTVKLIEKIGISWIEFYSRRLGITSPLNADYTLALGSSSVTLYEMTRAFSIFGRGGRWIRPKMIKKIKDHEGKIILQNISLDQKFKILLEAFQNEFKENWEEYWENKKNKEVKSLVFFEDMNQIISKQTAYLITSLLQGVIFDRQGTGAGARSLDRPVAGKTGTTNSYNDAWFIGYSPELITGVWTGFDNQESIGQSETGSRAALPIWYEFMKETLDEKEPEDFKIPEDIVFANIDNETGFLASASSKDIVKQAFLKGTEPKEQEEEFVEDEDQMFLREDLSL